MTNSQAAAHENWLLRCFPRVPGFSREHSASIPPHSARVSWRSRDPPPPLFLHANFVAIRENIFDSSVESDQGFRGESSTLQPPCYRLILHYKFHKFFETLPQSRTDLGHIPLSSRCARHFSLPHHAPIFSRIHPLDGQGRHVWQIARQQPMKAGWWDAPLVLRDLAMSNLHDFFRWLETEHWHEMG